MQRIKNTIKIERNKELNSDKGIVQSDRSLKSVELDKRVNRLPVGRVVKSGGSYRLTIEGTSIEDAAHYLKQYGLRIGYSWVSKGYVHCWLQLA